MMSKLIAVLALLVAPSTAMNTRRLQDGGNACWAPSDLDGDNSVGVSDLMICLEGFGVNAIGDVDSDGDTDVADILFVLSEWGCGSSVAVSPLCEPGVDCTPFIAEFAEGSSNNKYLEFYNPTTEEVSLDDYAYPNTNNSPDGNPSGFDYWNMFEAGATVAPGDVYIVCHSSADQSILDHCDETHNGLSNGDDAYCLVQCSGACADESTDSTDFTTVDCVGDIGADPGSSWDVCGLGDTKDNTLIRDCSVTSGNGGDWWTGSTAATCEWSVEAQNYWDAAGFHSNCGGDG